MRVALWQYPIEELASWDAWQAKLARGIADAAGQGARLVVVPEYASMELVALMGADVRASLPAQLAAMQPLLPRYIDAYGELARVHRVAIVAGSFPEHVAASVYRNRARVFGPAGAIGVVEKRQMTRFERTWGVSGGDAQAVFELDGERFAVAVCYDAEFPLIVRALAVAGAELVCVPSCTDALAGYHRVRVAAAARALENQCVVVQAPTVGTAPWSIAVDENRGAAGAFGPPDHGFPHDGVLALGELDRAQLVVVDVDLAAVAQVREGGQVLGHAHWRDSEPALAAPITRVRL